MLIDWNPRYLYRKLFTDHAAMERFLSEVCNSEWNNQQDRGRSWAEAVEMLSARHPHQSELIQAYHLRWEEMLGGPIHGTVEILKDLDAARHDLHALTNWSAETFHIARARYAFLGSFRQIVVSGEERVMKPDPEIFHRLVKRVGRPAAECVFIDDNPENVEAAGRLGFDAIRFTAPSQLRQDLRARGLV